MGVLRMKNIALVGVTLALAMAAGSVFAANSMNTGVMGLNVNTEDNFLINGKYFVAKDMAILGGFGLGIQGGDNNNGTDIGLLAGVRKYMKTDDFAPFVGGRFEYSSTKDSNVKNLNILVEAGAEYFVAKQFSVEGRVSFGYISGETLTTVTTVFGTFPATQKSNCLCTAKASISANFYF